jgi:TPR repeat protein
MRPAPAARRVLLALLGAVVVGSAGVALAQRYPPPPEPALAQELLDARWPADIVIVGERYVAAYPQGPYAATARAELDRARNTRRLLERSDIRLYRGDFLARDGSPTLYVDVRKAALADKEAAARIAGLYREGEGANPGRYVGWLQYAAALGNATASYELAVHYRKSAQPALAAPYEARAEELGFKPPPTLDHIRK